MVLIINQHHEMSIIMLKISVQLYMKDLIVPYRYAYMSALMVLIAVETAYIFEGAVRKDADFVAESDAATRRVPCTGIRSLIHRCRSGCGKAVLSQSLPVG
jgi:hypothetical protein